jgi:hypothetical protein
LTPIIFTGEALSILLLLWRILQRNLANKIKLIYLSFMIFSVMTMLFGIYKYTELLHIQRSLISCDKVSAQAPMCYFPSK